jgi:DNA polymerase
VSKFNRFLFCDFETYFDTDFSLRKLSPPEYILDHRYETLLMAAYDPRWDAPRIVLAEDIPKFLEKYPPEQTIGCSHNALFDLAILAWRYGWVPGRMADTLGMVRALRNYKKNSLGAVKKQLFGSDTKGDTLPKVKGLRAAGIKQAGLWGEFCTYAMNDVRDCFMIYGKLAKEFPMEEHRVMDLVLRAAVQPTLHADVPLLEKHLEDLRSRKARLLRECGFDKAALMSTHNFKTALEDLGVEIKHKTSPTGKWIPQFSKTDPFMEDLLYYANPAYDDDVNYAVQTLAAARLSHKSTIEETRAERFLNIAKLPWPVDPVVSNHQKPVSDVNEPVSDVNGSRILNGHRTLHLLPVALRYGGAHTHRLSGEWKLNMQNLPRDKTKSRLREALVAPPGHMMITADLAQIEARIVAMLCGQVGLVEQFRRGEDVYAQFASIVFRRTITKGNNPAERFLGKTAILGLGYGCGHERYYQMVVTQARQAGISLDGLFDIDIAQQTVGTYRTLFAFIPQAWRKLDHFLSHTINSTNPTQQSPWGPVTAMSGRILLPNRMYLRYNQNEEYLYGAKLLENITQALARIVVMQAAVRLAAQGYRFVLQAHDELVFVVPESDVEAACDAVRREMIQDPAWLPGLPLAVEIGVGKNYGACK